MLKSDFYVYPLYYFEKAELSRARIGADTFGGEGGGIKSEQKRLPPLPLRFHPEPQLPSPPHPPIAAFLVVQEIK